MHNGTRLRKSNIRHRAKTPWGVTRRENLPIDRCPRTHRIPARFPPGTMILDFMRRLTRRENFQPFLSYLLFFFFFLRDPLFIHQGREGGCSSIVGKSEEVFVHLMDITDKQRNPYRNIYTVKFLFRGYNFSSPGDGYRWKTIHRRGSNVPAQHLLFKIYDVD